MYIVIENTQHYKNSKRYDCIVITENYLVSTVKIHHFKYGTFSSWLSKLNNHFGHVLKEKSPTFTGRLDVALRNTLRANSTSHRTTSTLGYIIIWQYYRLLTSLMKFLQHSTNLWHTKIIAYQHQHNHVTSTRGVTFEATILPQLPCNRLHSWEPDRSCVWMWRYFSHRVRGECACERCVWRVPWHAILFGASRYLKAARRNNNNSIVQSRVSPTGPKLRRISSTIVLLRRNN